jgi:hypothetical protein
MGELEIWGDQRGFFGRYREGEEGRKEIQSEGILLFCNDVALRAFIITKE